MACRKFKHVLHTRETNWVRRQLSLLPCHFVSFGWCTEPDWAFSQWYSSLDWIKQTTNDLTCFAAATIRLMIFLPKGSGIRKIGKSWDVNQTWREKTIIVYSTYNCPCTIHHGVFWYEKTRCTDIQTKGRSKLLLVVKWRISLIGSNMFTPCFLYSMQHITALIKIQLY